MVFFLGLAIGVATGILVERHKDFIINKVKGWSNSL